jgi:hypothetical protein
MQDKIIPSSILFFTKMEEIEMVKPRKRIRELLNENQRLVKEPK